MLSSQEEQAERRRVFAQDQSVQRQATTMHAFAQADAATTRGRFSAHEAATVVGAEPTINYPAASPHQHDPCGQEPPLGFEIDQLEPSFPSVQAPGEPADAPLDVERVGSPLSSRLRRF